MPANKSLIGPYHQDEARAFLYCMIGDEPLMFQPIEQLNPYQRKHVEAMRFDILVWSMCFLPISRARDGVYLDRLFLGQKDFFDWHCKMYARMGLRFTDDVRFREPHEIYADAIKHRGPEQRISTVCFSHQVNDACDVADQLTISKLVNSKVDLARRAEKAGFRTPRSILLEKRQITPEKIAAHFGFPGDGLFFKTDGLGGGFNVKYTDDFAEYAEFARDFAPETIFVVQEKVNTPSYRECIADFVVRSTGVELLSVRRKLTSENHWFGNFYSPDLKLTAPQIDSLEKCVWDVHGLGYRSDEGYICGIDFFHDDSDLTITEINARWTGGLPVAILLGRLELSDEGVYSHLDEIFEDEIPQYRALVEEHLYVPGERSAPAFRIVPVSFSPKVNDGKLMVWFAIAGDYKSFLEEKSRFVSERSLLMSEIVRELA